MVHSGCRDQRRFFLATGRERLVDGRADRDEAVLRLRADALERDDDARAELRLRALLVRVLLARAVLLREAVDRPRFADTERVEALARDELRQTARRDAALRRAPDFLANARPRLTALQPTERYRTSGAGFQPVAKSARNSGSPSTVTATDGAVTAHAEASARSARTSEITRSGRRARDSKTRLVSSTTNMSRSGSIQIDVPENPVWP